MRILVFILGALFALSHARATTVNDLARIKGQGESIIQGLGLVVGLNGTGDSGKELVVARPLAQVLENNGLPIASLEELKNSKSVALVLITCVVPGTGARTDDKLDVRVSVVNSATSLAGGTLYLAPLTGPYPGDPVYAIAQGEVHVEGNASPRTGIVRGGARLIRDIPTGIVGDSFQLVLNPHAAGWAAASEIAASITQQVYGRASADSTLPPVARVIDDHTIRIDIPAPERADRAAFIAEVLSTDVNAALLNLPAKVICNRRSGAIIVTGNVQISPVAITHKDLSITTVLPPIEPTPATPVVQNETWTNLPATPKPGEQARLQDLLEGFKRLSVPVEEQIEILSMLHRGGQLHAQLIVE